MSMMNNRRDNLDGSLTFSGKAMQSGSCQWHLKELGVNVRLRVELDR